MINQRPIRAFHVGCSCSCRRHDGAFAEVHVRADGKSAAASTALAVPSARRLLLQKSTASDALMR